MKFLEFNSNKQLVLKGTNYPLSEFLDSISYYSKNGRWNLKTICNHFGLDYNIACGALQELAQNLDEIYKVFLEEKD